jgi:hypothetical protein
MEVVPGDNEITVRFGGISELQAAALVVGAFGKLIAAWEDVDPQSPSDAAQVAFALDGVAKVFMGADAMSSITGARVGEISHRIAGTAGLIIDTAIASFQQRPDWFAEHLVGDQFAEAQLQFPPTAVA